MTGSHSTLQDNVNRAIHRPNAASVLFHWFLGHARSEESQPCTGRLSAGSLFPCRQRPPINPSRVRRSQPEGPAQGIAGKDRQTQEIAHVSYTHLTLPTNREG